MKRKLFSIFIIILFVGFNNVSFGQNITGKVVDKSTAEDVIGAVVTIDGTTIGTVTNTDGTFSLVANAGDLKVKISFIGYVEQIVSVTMVEGKDLNMGTIQLEADAVGLDELLVVANFAKDRQTAVAFSTIAPELIMEKLGTQEYPEILKSTPSVYTTKTGGGYGDGRINMRGFDGNNIGVLINGVPVNDMEWGKVYWSNWAGLSDVTRTMQVQRGLGYSKLALSSVGGTINILTKTTDVKKGGSVFYAIGNDNYVKKSFTISTGLTEKGWAVTASGSQTSGDGYAQGTNFNGYAYFFNLSKRLNDKQTLAFTVFGAPQWHNQRGMHNIQEYRDQPEGRLYNSNTGFRDGEVFNGAYAYNNYHKPQASINHTWAVNRTTNLSTSIYASQGRGYGRRMAGTNTAALSIGYPTGIVGDGVYTTGEGYLDYDRVIAENDTARNGSNLIFSKGYNSHDWYGIVSSLTTKVGDVNVTAGVDGRYYKGYHYYEIDDLMGGDYFIKADGNPNRDNTTPLYVGDRYDKNYYGEVVWGGLFLQGEYTSDAFSAFVSTAVSESMYRRTDEMNYLIGEHQTEWQNFLGYSAKGGLNYNLNDNHNVFFNTGYFSKAPFFTYVFISDNEINPDPQFENVFSTELGYGFRKGAIQADLTLYRTMWMNKSYSKQITNDEILNMVGLDALHQGVEFELTYTPTKKVDIRGMISVGDWKWNNDAVANVVSTEGELMDVLPIYSGGVHVGDAAQTTAAIGINAEVLPKLKVGMDFNYYDRLYANFGIEGRTVETDAGVDSWLMPSYNLLDFNVKYRFKLGKLNSTLYGKVNNLFDVEYLAESKDGSSHTAMDASVYYGYGRTWSLGLKINF